MNTQIKFCENCTITKDNTNKSNIKISEFSKGYIIGFDGNINRCPYCKTELKDISITANDFFVIREASNCNRQLLESMIKLHDTDIIEYELKMSQFRTQVQQQEQIKQISSEANKIKCPRCGSTSITTGARGVNQFWGLLGASQTVNRCANCGHTWKPTGK